MEDVPATEIRPYSPKELAAKIQTRREAHGWSQELLAEFATLTSRTVQRVEAGDPSSLNRKRALARAFKLEDIDAFNRPYEFLTLEGAARAKEDFDQRYTTLEINPIDGRGLVTQIVACDQYRAFSTGALAPAPRTVEDVYARVIDYLSDLIDILDDIGRVEMLGYGDDIEEMIAEMRVEGWEVACGSRRVRLTRARLPAVLWHVLAVPVGGGKRTVAVPKASEG